ncbi:hypothetical protein CLV28_0175 [Sediminihabitans luteus]|uniref:Uncharacterized protein n=1 Tax=Sediminihabitans luteus TaxID=1138585 RepID=A0A2M9CYM9_9CELL|nr:hypothetical protein [Sediminihabitans luteus]PJJ76963.1 hypothetical protein CLV28_0175 [Sediminihabitans luteus]GII99604.1 hypothetical protein Slu03_19820 [Sediminihabitans luteus]
MRIQITAVEAAQLATAADALPPGVTRLTGSGPAVRAEIDLREIPDAPAGLRFAARLLPVVHATLGFVSYDNGHAVVQVAVDAAGLPAEKLIGWALPPLDKALVKQGLPRGLVRLATGPGTRVTVDVRAALAAKVPGVTVTSVTYDDGIFTVDASVDAKAVALRPR